MIQLSLAAIGNAYSVLSNPDQRSLYDQLGPEEYNSASQGGGRRGFSRFEGRCVWYRL